MPRLLPPSSKGTEAGVPSERPPARALVLPCGRLAVPPLTRRKRFARRIRKPRLGGFCLLLLNPE